VRVEIRAVSGGITDGGGGISYGERRVHATQV
jgi:hypothetical protein